MSNLPEQFSAARKAQLEAQLDAFRHFSGKAVENTEKLIALNLKTTRASVEKSTAAFQQLLAAKDPRDLFALSAHSRDGFDTLLDYSRALFGIAGSVRADAPASSVRSALAAPAPREPANDEAHGADDEDYSEDDDEQAAGEASLAGADTASPRGEAPDARDEPIIVSLRAADEAEADPDPLPLAADDAIQIDVSGIKPVDATPPPAPGTYPGKSGNGKLGESSTSKGARRK